MLLALPCRGESSLAGRIYSLQGRVEVSNDDGNTWSSASRFQDLNQGALIRTGPLSRVSILLVDKSLLKVDSDSTLGLAGVIPSDKIKLGALVKTSLTKARRSIYRIFRGRFWIRSSAVLDVETPLVVIGVRGTEFGLSVKGDGTTYLSMLEGRAVMSNSLGTMTVASGEEGVVKPGMPPSKRILLKPEDAVQWSLFYPAQVSFKDYYFVSPDPVRLLSELSKVKKALEDGNRAPLLLIRQGRLLHDLGKYRDARESFQGALKSDGLETAVYEGLGWVELQAGNMERAARYFARIDSPTEMSILGESSALYQTDRTHEALDLVTTALRSLKKMPKLLVQSALLKLIYGKPDEALKDLKKSQDIEKSAIGLGLMSNIFLIRNQKEMALDAVEDAIKLNPWSSTAYTDLAWVKQSYFDLPGAMEASRKSIELDPKNIRARIVHSQLLFGSGFLKEARAEVKNVLSLNPDEALAHSLDGYLLLAERETEKAVKAFKTAINLDHTLAQPHQGLGIAYMRGKNIPEAYQEMLVATLLEPNISMNYTYLGKTLYQIRDFKEAKKILKKAMVLDPMDPTPHLYSGIINTDLNKVAQGVRDLERSVVLNDNRAVYRSRFLLDQDRAVKNIDLARTYGKLGLTAMARNRAVLSLKDDPNNSSAHLFMAKVLIEEKDRTAAAGSEILKSLLLQPANQNSFNSFNEYTTFFEQADISGSPEIQIGNQDTQKYIGDFWGGWKDLAFRELVQYSKTDGYKTNNSDRLWFTDTQLKYQLGLNQDFLVRYNHIDGERGDQSQDLNAFANEDFDETINSKISKFTLGYHLKTSPTSDVLFVLRRDITESVDQDGPLSEVSRTLFPGVDIQQIFNRLTFDQSYWHLAATHGFRYKTHRILYGLEYLTGESEVEDIRNENLTFFFPPPILIENPPIRNKIDPNFLSVFIKDTWRIHPKISMEGGLSYDRTTDGTTVPIFSSDDFEIDKINPQIGIIYNPNHKTTFRLGYARFLQGPFITPEQLRPIDIAGFTIGQNALSSAHQEDLSLAWEWQIGPQRFLKGKVYKRKRTEQVEDPDFSLFREKTRDFYGGRVEWNQIFAEHFGVNAAYTFVRNEEREFEHSFLSNPKRWRDDHEFQIGLDFLHPTGWKIDLDAEYIKQTLSKFETEDPSGFWLVNFSIEKELFNKHLDLGFRMDNLFDEDFEIIQDELSIDARLPSRQFFFFARYNF